VNIWQTIIEKGRLCQWLVISSGLIISVTGGLTGFLDGEKIVEVFRYMVITAGGVEVIKQVLSKVRGPSEGS